MKFNITRLRTILKTLLIALLMISSVVFSVIIINNSDDIYKQRVQTYNSYVKNTINYFYNNSANRQKLIENPKYILEEIKNNFGFDISLLDKTTLPKNSFSIIKEDSKIYSVFECKLSNTQNPIILVCKNDITNIYKDKEEHIFKMILMIFVSASLTAIFISFIINYSVKKFIAKERESLKKSRELFYRARHDDLTNLPNLKQLNNQLHSFKEYSVIMLNIENLSIINTTYGQRTTDVVLIKSSKFIKNNLPSNAHLYNINSSEFAIVLEKPIADQETMLASQIKAYFEQSPIIVKGIRIHIHFSFGIAQYDASEHSNKLTTLAKANIALVEAKHKGRGVILKYDKSMSAIGSYTRLAENIAILQKDLEDENIIPFYQAIVDTNTQKVLKYEVLARIKNGDTFISPHEFMQAATVAGLQSAITKQIIEVSFKYFSNTDKEFSINITKYDFSENYLLKFLKRKAKKYNIEPKRITLEILEDIAIENDPEMIQQINDLYHAGYVIAIDDFGVESSNISKLSDLKAEFIKIDGSFIKDMDTNKKHLDIVESLVYMAKKLDMKVIAEFVCNEEIHKIVKDLGIDYSQGYYFAEPKKDIL
jgi:diguanylate cyclase (GGDEF)-like protein